MGDVCERCGTRLLHTGEARVLVPFTAHELVATARGTIDADEATGDEVRDRLLNALGLIDPEREKEERKPWSERAR